MYLKVHFRISIVGKQDEMPLQFRGRGGESSSSPKYTPRMLKYACILVFLHAYSWIRNRCPPAQATKCVWKMRTKKSLLQAFPHPSYSFLTNHIIIYWSSYSRMDQVKLFKGCLPQISLGPFLNTLTHIIII